MRPMQQRSRARSELQSLFEARAPLYAEAELVVDTSALDADHSAKRVAAAAAKS